MPIFSIGEMERRVNNLRQKMAKSQIDCVIATSYVGSYYFSGVPIHWFGRPLATVIPLEGEPAIIESMIELEHTQANTWIKSLHTYLDFNTTFGFENLKTPLESMVTLVKSVLHESNLTRGRIGIEGGSIPMEHYRALQAALPEAQFTDVSTMLATLRLILSQEELRLVRAADEIADVGQQAIINLVAPGKSAMEIELPAKKIMIDAVCERYQEMPFHLHAISGLGSGNKNAGHSEWTIWNKKDAVKQGQLLETIVDVWLWGYWGNVERAVGVGKPNKAMQKPFKVMIEANEAAINVVKPGILLSDVDRAAKEVIVRHGYDTRTGTGCGRGITSYEGNARELLMDLRPYSDVILQPGMAFSIEPDVREPGVGTFRHCNTIIVTEDGCEVDSRTPRGIIWV
jgi:Xaa-Pro dipeptidase